MINQIRNTIIPQLKIFISEIKLINSGEKGKYFNKSTQGLTMILRQKKRKWKKSYRLRIMHRPTEIIQTKSLWSCLGKPRKKNNSLINKYKLSIKKLKKKSKLGSRFVKKYLNRRILKRLIIQQKMRRINIRISLHNKSTQLQSGAHNETESSA